MIHAPAAAEKNTRNAAADSPIAACYAGALSLLTELF